MKKTFEKELPAGYSGIKTVDFKNVKSSIAMNVFAFAPLIIVTVLAYYIIKPTDFYGNLSNTRNIIAMAVMLLMIVVHELIHGLAYKALTKEKLKFGIGFGYAYCGIPDIYVYRKTALISLLAPFVVFTVLFGTATIFLPNDWDKMYAAVLLGIHIGSCGGDLYDSYLYFFKLKSPDTLMLDTGPKQVFYIKN